MMVDYSILFYRWESSTAGSLGNHWKMHSWGAVRQRLEPHNPDLEPMLLSTGLDWQCWSSMHWRCGSAFPVSLCFIWRCLASLYFALPGLLLSILIYWMQLNNDTFILSIAGSTSARGTSPTDITTLPAEIKGLCLLYPLWPTHGSSDNCKFLALWGQKLWSCTCFFWQDLWSGVGRQSEVGDIFPSFLETAFMKESLWRHPSQWKWGKRVGYDKIRRHMGCLEGCIP